ncbi:hypothetical protein [Caulobacter soli]|uniref:hypothetical protein n=1 Tax=Caulobacter soli TaxID=2708539 RepID=UPI00196A3520|nr:hypothetical protein [Caulobacter soli]
MILRLAAATAALALLATPAFAAPEGAKLDAIAQDFVRLTLEAGVREPGYVDAYYGPAEWASVAKAKPRDVPALRAEADRLAGALKAVDGKALDPDEIRRKAFLAGQVKAAQTRLAMLAGVKFSFQDEAEGLFGVRPPIKPLSAYDPVLARIDKLVPGEGDLATRVTAFQARYTIPTDRLEPVMKAAIAECKARTQAHIALPANERFDLAFVTKKPWSGYNWYKGDAHSLIEVNTDLPTPISRAVDLGCHEGYPGHHVLNTLLEEKLTKARGWVEFSVYPLFSPQSLIAEGSANYGIKLAFPGEEKVAFERKVLYPLAGLDPATADTYDALSNATAELASVQNTVADLYLSGKLDKAAAVDALAKYTLATRAKAEKSLSFIETYRSYVINYNLGQDMVRAHVERAGPSQDVRWKRMEAVISQPTTPADLTK